MTVTAVQPKATPTARKVLQHAAGLLAMASVFAGGLNYLYALLLTHQLTAAQYTVFAGAQAVLVITGVIGSAGVPWVLARETAASTEGSLRRREAVTFAFWANVAFGVVLGGVVGLVVVIFGTGREAALVAATVVVLAIGSTGLGVLQGRGSTTMLSGLFTLEAVVKVGVGWVLVAMLGAETPGALAGSLVGAFVIWAALPAVRGHVGRPRRPATDASLWWAAARIGGLQTGVGVLTALDVLVVATLPGSREAAAQYQVAATLGKVPLFVAIALATAVFPTLVHADARRRRAGALWSYAVVGGYAWLLLLTVPDSLVAAVFPGEYTGLVRWLPWTAALGFALGALALVTAFVQSLPTLRRSLPRVLSAVGVFVLATAAGAMAGGVAGLAAGAVAGAWIALALTLSLSTERPALGDVVRRAVRPVSIAVTAVAAAALLATSGATLPWVATVAVTLPVVLVAAFPEFAHALRSVGRAPSRRPARQLPE